MSTAWFGFRANGIDAVWRGTNRATISLITSQNVRLETLNLRILIGTCRSAVNKYGIVIFCNGP